MSEPEDHAARQRKKEVRAETARQGFLAGIGVDLMNAFNRDKTDPTQMAVIGGDTARGYEFLVQRDGKVAVVEVRMRSGD